MMAINPSAREASRGRMIVQEASQVAMVIRCGPELLSLTLKSLLAACGAHCRWP